MGQLADLLRSTASEGEGAPPLRQPSEGVEEPPNPAAIARKPQGGGSLSSLLREPSLATEGVEARSGNAQPPLPRASVPEESPSFLDALSDRLTPSPSLSNLPVRNGNFISNALAPLTEIIPAIRQEARAALEQSAEPGISGSILGPLRYYTSPITGAYEALVSKPVERITGSERAGRYAGIAAQLLTPGIGLVRAPVALRAVEALPKTLVTARDASLGARDASLGEGAASAGTEAASAPVASTTAPVAALDSTLPRPSDLVGGVPGGLPGRAAPAAIEVESAAPIARPVPLESPPGGGKTSPLPINPEALAIEGDQGLAYSKALHPEIFRKASTAAIEYFKANPLIYNRKFSVTENIGQNLGEGRISPKFLKQFGLEADQAKVVIDTYETMRQSAGRMAQMSRVSRDLGLRIDALPAAQRDAIAVAGRDLEDAAEVLPWWKRIDNITRGAIVSQLSTAVRNAETVFGRLGLDTMTNALDAGIAKMLGKAPKVNALDGLETFMNTVKALRPKNYQEQKRLTVEISQAFPGPTKRLLESYNGELRAAVPTGPVGGMAEKVLRSGERVVELANTANRFQEFLIRRAVFQAKLGQDVRRATGRELADMMKSGEVFQIPEEAVRGAVDRALDVTFATRPKPGSSSDLFVQLMNKVPFSSVAIPFPRFLTQALKFNTEHSPAGFLRYLSAAERAKVAEGDVSGISKAVVGSTLLGTAYLMRQSSNAGARWYEYIQDDGDTVDLRPYAPFSTYLFMAEVMHNMLGTAKTPKSMSAKEIADGLLGANIRAGTGLALLDSAIDAGTSAAKQGDVVPFLKQLAGEYVGRLAVPFAQLRDLYDEITDGVSVLREKSPEGSKFVGPTIASLPGLSRTLPEVVSPTQGGPLLTKHPFFLKQLTGTRVTPAKNPGAAELDRLGFQWNEILPKTGDTNVDRKYAAELGPMVEQRLSQFVRRPAYQRLTDAERGVMLGKVMTLLRRVSKARADLDPRERLRLGVGRLPARERALLEERGYLR